MEIPFYSTIELAAGFGSCTTDNQKVELLRFSRSTFNQYGVQPSDAVAFKVHGDSMSPVIPDSSIVTISTGHTKIIESCTAYPIIKSLFVAIIRLIILMKNQP